MAIKVILFGQLIEKAGGQSAVEMQEVRDTDQLETQLLERFPALAGSAYRVAVDKKIITGNRTVPDGVTVALLPPFSGG